MDMPLSLPKAVVDEVLTRLGIPLENLISVEITGRGITVTHRRADVDGRSVVVGNEIAKTVTSIGMDRE